MSAAGAGVAVAVTKTARRVGRATMCTLVHREKSAIAALACIAPSF